MDVRRLDARGALEQDCGEGEGDDDDRAELGQREPEVGAEGWFSRRVSTAVAGTGLGVAARFELIATVDNYVAGNVLHAVESLARARAAEADPAMVAAAA